MIQSYLDLRGNVGVCILTLLLCAMIGASPRQAYIAWAFVFSVLGGIFWGLESYRFLAFKAEDLVRATSRSEIQEISKTYREKSVLVKAGIFLAPLALVVLVHFHPHKRDSLLNLLPYLLLLESIRRVFVILGILRVKSKLPSDSSNVSG